MPRATSCYPAELLRAAKRRADMLKCWGLLFDRLRYDAVPGLPIWDPVGDASYVLWGARVEFGVPDAREASADGEAGGFEGVHVRVDIAPRRAGCGGEARQGGGRGGFARQLSQELLLAAYPPDIRRRAAPVADVGERLHSVQGLGACRYVDLASIDSDPYRFVYFECDPAQSVDYLLHPAEVYDDVVVHPDAGQVLERLDSQIRASAGEGGVDLVLPDPGYVDECIARYGEHAASRLGDHDSVRARGLRSPRVATEQDHPLPAERYDQVDEHEGEEDQQDQEQGPEDSTPPLTVNTLPSRPVDFHAHNSIVVNKGEVGVAAATRGRLAA